MQTIDQRRPARTFFAAIRLTSLTVLTLCLSMAAQAQTISNVRIGVLDTERVLLTSETGKAAYAQLKTLQEQREAELSGKADELKSIQSKINEGHLGADELASLQEEFKNKTATLARAQDDARRELDSKRNAVLQDLDRKIMPIVTQFAKEQGYQLIFRKFESGLVYADDATDITAQVIQRLDAGGLLRSK